VVGTSIAYLFLRSALHVFRDAAAVRRAHERAAAGSVTSVAIAAPAFYDAGHDAGGKP